MMLRGTTSLTSLSVFLSLFSFRLTLNMYSLTASEPGFRPRHTMYLWFHNKSWFNLKHGSKAEIPFYLLCRLIKKQTQNVGIFCFGPPVVKLLPLTHIQIHRCSPTSLSWQACWWQVWTERSCRSRGRAGRLNPHWREWRGQTSYRQSGHLEKTKSATITHSASSHTCTETITGQLIHCI